MYYYSRIINNNVMIIQLDNSCHKYWDFQIPKLASDIADARANGYTVLIFQHEPISTGNPKDAACEAYYEWDNNPTVRNFYDECVGGAGADEATETVYNLITRNADIIRGIFCGHYHTCFYTEIEGSYTDSNGRTCKKTIPQQLLECNAYENMGHILKITVE